MKKNQIDKKEYILSMVLVAILTAMAHNYLKRVYVLTSTYNGVIVSEVLTKWVWEK